MITFTDLVRNSESRKLNGFDGWSSGILNKGPNQADIEEWRKCPLSNFFNQQTRVADADISSDLEIHKESIQQFASGDFNFLSGIFPEREPAFGIRWVEFNSDEVNRLTVAQDGNHYVKYGISQNCKDAVCVNKTLIDVCTQKSDIEIGFDISRHTPGTMVLSADIIVRSGCELNVVDAVSAADARNAFWVRILLEPEAKLSVSTACFNKGLSKASYHVFLKENSEFRFVSAAIVPDCAARHIKVVADHMGAASRSDQVHRAILNGKAVCEFDTQSHIRHDAPGSDSHQLSKHMIFGDQAQVFANPTLKIDTDDVSCGHGATVGGIDPDAVNYCRARGIDDKAARKMITKAFIEDSLNRMPESARKFYADNLTYGLRQLFQKEASS